MISDEHVLAGCDSQLSNSFLLLADGRLFGFLCRFFFASVGTRL